MLSLLSSQMKAAYQTTLLAKEDLEQRLKDLSEEYTAFRHEVELLGTYAIII